MDLNKQQVFDTEILLKVLIGNLYLEGNKTMVFILEKVQKTICELSRGAATLLLNIAWNNVRLI